ncbi:hypothetical protein ACLB2K_021941 [Fragaria x ananassa]
MKRRRRSSAPEPLPLQAVTPVKEEEKDDPGKNWQLLTAASASVRFGLPDGWCVQEIPRCSTSFCPQRVDRYFIEPDTGQKFRSLVAVRRYLTGGQVARQATADKQVTVDKQATVDKRATMQITPHTTRCSPSFGLPDGWKIEKKPRINTTYSDSDKYYIEPGTGRRFRSLVAVERYLAEENEHTPLQALIPANKLTVSSGSSGQKKKIQSRKIVSKNSSHSNDCNSTLNASRLNTYSSPAEHFSSPQKEFPRENSRTLHLNSSSRPTIKWVLVDRGGNEWNPFMDDSMVEDSVKQKWSEIFKSTIYGENIKPPIF